MKPYIQVQWLGMRLPTDDPSKFEFHTRQGEACNTIHRRSTLDQPKAVPISS